LGVGEDYFRAAGHGAELGLDRWRPTPLAALELDEIPSELHFVRDHFPAPDWDLGAWSLELIGSSGLLRVDLDTLKRLPARTLSVVLECAGHRRAEFEPLPGGLPWELGAVAEAHWTGTSLASVLQIAGIPADAHEVVLEGADAGVVAEVGGIHRFARSLPLDKALDPDVLLTYAMNGQPISLDRGGPVRLVVPGWYATDSVKWLDRIWFTDREFEGFFQAIDYRFCAPGEDGFGRRLGPLPVHALITTPVDGEARPGNELVIRGTAWGGAGGIADVLVQVDAGPWSRARLGAAPGPYTRVSWESRVTLDPGAHELACRAIDGAGETQPDEPPANQRGYANNAVHRITFVAT